jgi:hypothetical protein
MIRSYKRLALAVGLGLVVGLMLILLGKCYYENFLLSLRVAFAEDQIEIFDEMRTRALQSPPAEAVEFLEYVVEYYPSGTKQVPGSPLDRIVERARQNAIKEIIASLRDKTGRDYGDDPKRWIAELSRRQE